MPNTKPKSDCCGKCDNNGEPGYISCCSCPCHNSAESETPTKGGWEEEFDKKFEGFYDYELSEKRHYKLLKKFITAKISEARKDEAEHWNVAGIEAQKLARSDERRRTIEDAERKVKGITDFIYYPDGENARWEGRQKYIKEDLILRALQDTPKDEDKEIRR